VSDYQNQAIAELDAWKRKVQKAPGPFDAAAKHLQTRVNALIPEKVHAAVTKVIEQMTKGILIGSDFTAPAPFMVGTLEDRETKVRARIDSWKKIAATEGGIAGAGGFLLAAADFPVLISLKIKTLFDIGALYGRDGADFAERLFILRIFELAFSSARHRVKVFDQLEAWREVDPDRPTSFEDFDWRSFQQEYRDYIDLAKLAQLLPIVGAPVGAMVNWRLLERLGETAMMAYRMRWLAEQAELQPRMTV